MTVKETYRTVQEGYGKYAKGYDQDLQSSEYSRKVATAFGYSPEELASIPDGSNMGLGCGNPTATAKLRPGETVIDLGSGAGFDVFLAAKKVAPNGKAIGVDMNEDMLKRAHANAQKTKISNVEFVESPINAIALPSACADCIISNCVINLVPEDDKPAVFREIFRLLRPGGRVAVSDILAKKELPGALKNDMALYVGCISGASQVHQYEQYLKDAGFEDTVIVNKESDLNVYKEGSLMDDQGRVSSSKDEAPAGCCGSSCSRDGEVKNGAEGAESTMEYDINEWVGKFKERPTTEAES
ncbi:MAG: hypothetical protein M1833_002980 [Piccolia ochrophora]|nr:MAG: hypothetical protein M1833_002980 [Piccolia ochrophora]